MKFELHIGDCIEVMRSLPANSVDSVVTDPPYGIGFMGKAWDGKDIEARHAARSAAISHDPIAGPNGAHKSIAAEAGRYDLTPKAMRAFQEFSRAWAAEAFRVLKPGGHLLSFASSRTYHRMASGVEDAGFEIRDQCIWLYGEGFPKSLNVAKANEEAADWEGWGTALKPAHEPLVLARKPLAGTVVQNILAHSTGALNIDACRVASGERAPFTGAGGLPRRSVEEQRGPGVVSEPSPLGRWPANVQHDGSVSVVALFPEDAGAQSPVKGTEPSPKTSGIYGAMKRVAEPSQNDANDGAVGFKMKPGARRIDEGSAARFFYCSKASATDRDEGLQAFALAQAGIKNVSGRGFAQGDPYAEVLRRNTHPTVKPTDLMRYYVRLVTRRGGVVLDPFMGSGSTGKACMLENMEFIGIELDPAHERLARARIEFAQRQGFQHDLLEQA